MFGMQKRLLTTALVGLFGVVVPAAWADEQVDYLSQIKPIFTSRCVACHGALKQEAGLRLDTAAAAIRGGESGAAILAAKPASSELLGRIRSTDASERMPAEGDPLTPQQIALIESWIEQGALAPPDEQPERDPRDHWAFRPLVMPQVPGVSKVDWVRNPIDAFVADYQQSHDLTPQVEASRDELVRRLMAVGTADQCRDKVAEYLEAGVTCPILYPIMDDIGAVVDAFAGWEGLGGGSTR